VKIETYQKEIPDQYQNIEKVIRSRYNETEIEKQEFTLQDGERSPNSFLESSIKMNSGTI